MSNEKDPIADLLARMAGVSTNKDGKEEVIDYFITQESYNGAQPVEFFSTGRDDLTVGIRFNVDGGKHIDITLASGAAVKTLCEYITALVGINMARLHSLSQVMHEDEQVGCKKAHELMKKSFDMVNGVVNGEEISGTSH